MARQRKGVAAKLALALGTSIVCLAVTEVLLERFYPIDAVYLELDARRIFRPLAGARAVKLPVPGSGASSVVWHFNAQGFRGAPLGPKSPQRERVVVYGDSFIHARETPLESTFVVRLQAELEERGRQVETVNAGLTAYGPDQSLLRFEEEVEWLHPDLVVLAICAQNDMKDLKLNNLFAIDEQGGLMETGLGLTPRYARRHERWKERSSGLALLRLARTVGGLARNTSDPAETAPDNFQSELRSWYVGCEAFAYIQADPASPLQAPEGARHAQFMQATAIARQELALFAEVLERFKSGCSSRSIPLVLMVIPCKFDLVREPSLRIDEREFALYSPRTMTDTFVRVAKDQGVPCLDVSGPFVEHGASALYFRGLETHWNAAGQALAASLLANFLAAGRNTVPEQLFHPR